MENNNDNNTKKLADEAAQAASKEGSRKTKSGSRKDSSAQSKEMESLRKALEEANAKVAKERDDYVRLMAEFETFRRRSAEDRLELVKSASADVIKGMLTTLDELERAMEMLSKSSDDAAREGTALIYNKLMDYLRTKGLEKIEAKGEKFDTDFHEAVTQFPSPDESMKGMVMDVVQNGYKLSGKVIRFAKVVVGA